MDWKESTNLTGFVDFPASGTEVSASPPGDSEPEFDAPDAAAFFRLDVE